jgi:hypothetical protein
VKNLNRVSAPLLKWCSLNLYQFLKFYVKVVDRLSADTAEKQIGLKSALFRIVADRL